VGTRNPKVDAYIAGAAPFARPILEHLREVVHAACPDVDEQIKWRMPSFEWRGMLCGMAAFKAHAVFGFWQHDLIVGDDPKAKEAMGSFGCLKSRSDLPSAAALKKDAKARSTLDGFPPSARAEYVEWIADAKQDATRTRRIATAIEWLAQGKRRNWKYEAC
jgi:hypothetical protein